MLYGIGKGSVTEVEAVIEEPEDETAKEALKTAAKAKKKSASSIN